MKGVLACGASSAIQGISDNDPIVPYDKAIFDVRFEDACAFAAKMASRHIATAEIRGDITNLFFDDLDLRWKHGPDRLAGFTTSASLFCLDLLARDRGMRLSHCVPKPSIEEALGVLDGALPRRRLTSQLPSSGRLDLVFWIIEPSADNSEKEKAHA